MIEKPLKADRTRFGISWALGREEAVAMPAKEANLLQDVQLSREESATQLVFNLYPNW